MRCRLSLRPDPPCFDRRKWGIFDSLFLARQMTQEASQEHAKVETSRPNQRLLCPSPHIVDKWPTDQKGLRKTGTETPSHTKSHRPQAFSCLP